MMCFSSAVLDVYLRDFGISEYDSEEYYGNIYVDNILSLSICYYSDFCITITNKNEIKSYSLGWEDVNSTYTNTEEWCLETIWSYNEK
jgi:hypothetical protein